MLIISTPRDFTEGNTIQIKINGDPATLYWRDHDALVVNDTDTREILQITEDSKMLNFMCGGAAGEPKLPLYVSTPQKENK